MTAPPRPPSRVPPAPTTPSTNLSPEPPPWRPVGLRTRGWLLVLAAITALVIGWLMLQPKLRLMAARADRGEAPVPIGLPTDAHRAAQARAGSQPTRTSTPADRAAEPPTCGDQPGPGCVGGPMPILVVPHTAASR